MVYKSDIARAKAISNYKTPPIRTVYKGTAPAGTPSQSIVGDGVLTYGVVLSLIDEYGNPIVRNTSDVVPIGVTVSLVINDDDTLPTEATEVTVSESKVWEESQQEAQLLLKNALGKRLSVYDAAEYSEKIVLAETLMLISVVTPAVGTKTAGDGFNVSEIGAERLYQSNILKPADIETIKNSWQQRALAVIQDIIAFTDTSQDFLNRKGYYVKGIKDSYVTNGDTNSYSF